MNAPMGLSPIGALLLLGMIAAQIAAIAVLPKSEGFTQLGWALAALAFQGLSLWLMALIIHRNVPISMVGPIIAALVPLAAIGIGVLVYGEQASPLKICLLLASCGAIAAASAVR